MTVAQDSHEPRSSNALLLSPHNDDAALFAAFTCHAERPYVVTVLRSVKQEAYGISAFEREREDDEALAILGCGWEQWNFRDDLPNWLDIEGQLRSIERSQGEHPVYVPLPEEGGHDHHNRIGEIAHGVFGDRCRFYATYTTNGKSTTGTLVEVGSGAVAAKLAALACYRSQSDLPDCRPHFLRGLEEYLT